MHRRTISRYVSCMPLVSAEVRWFVDVSQEEAVETFEHWFASGPFPTGGTVRTDVYGVDPSAKDVGIKVRGKNPGLEVKTLVDTCLAQVRFAGRDARVESWTKIASQAIELSRRATRCSMKKTRRLRRFDTGAGSAEEIELASGSESPKEPNVQVARGCNVEWTLVELDDPRTRAWSFGVEAFGADPRKSIVLTLAALDASAPPALDATWREESYPVWLARVTAR